MVDVGKRARQIREARRLDQRDVAKLAGINHNTVSRIELGRHIPSVVVLEKLAQGLGVPTEELVRDPKKEANFSNQPARVRRAILESWLDHFEKLEARRAAELDDWRDASSVPYMRPLEMYAFDRLDQARFERDGIHTHLERVISKRLLEIPAAEYELCMEVNKAMATVNELTAQARSMARAYADAEQARRVQSVAHDLDTLEVK